MADIESGMYYVVNMGAGENVSEENAFCLSRFGGSASDTNDMVIYRQDYRPTPIVSAVYVGTNDEISITAPSLSGRVASVPQSGITTSAQWTGTVTPTMRNAPAKNWTSTSARESHVGDVYAVLNTSLGTVDRVYEFAKSNDTYFWRLSSNTVDQYPNTNVLLKSEGNWGGRRGRWKMERIENLSMYYDGSPYPVYHLISAMSTDSHRVCMWASGSANGSRVKTAVPSDGTGAKSQYWAFIPVPSVPDGFYNIRMSLYPDRIMIGQSNGSVVLGSDTDRSDNRGVWVLTRDELEPDHQTVRNLEPIANDDNDSSYMMVPAAQAVERGHPNVGRVRGGGHFDRWVFVARDQSVEFNDNKYQGYEIWSNAFDYSFWAVSRYVLSSIVQWTEWMRQFPEFMLVNADYMGTPEAYQWFLTPAHAYDSKLTVPSRLGVEINGVTSYGTAGFTGFENCYPSWVGGENDGWQLRYRLLACRYAGDSNLATNAAPDGSWKSIFDNDSANEGWGDNEVFNCSATLTYNESNTAGRGASGRYRSDMPIGITLGTDDGEMDKVTIEFQVRPWSYSLRDVEGLTSHGGSASGLFTFAYKPTVTLSNLRVDAYGISVDYESDLHRDSNKIEISNLQYMTQLDYEEMPNLDSESVRYSRMRNQRKCDAGTAEYSGTYFADFGSIIPSLGEEVLLGWKITTIDGVVSSGVSLIPVISSDYSSAESVSLPVEFLDNGSRMLKVSCQNNGVSYFESRSSIAFLTINNRPGGSSAPSEFVANESNSAYLETIRIPRSEFSDGYHYMIPYPFRKPFKVTVIGNGANGVAKRFEYYHAAFDEFRDRTRIWNYGSYAGNDEWYEIFVNESENPSETVTTSLTSQATKTTERNWEIVQFGNTPEQPRSVSGVVYPGLMPDYIQRTEKFSKCKFAWYRSFDGEVIRVAVTSVRETRKTWGDAITVEMRRTDA